ncbi:hypothetical protein GCM10009527_003210 [Actinomadura nitritigenes]
MFLQWSAAILFPSSPHVEAGFDGFPPGGGPVGGAPADARCGALTAEPNRRSAPAQYRLHRSITVAAATLARPHRRMVVPAPNGMRCAFIGTSRAPRVSAVRPAPAVRTESDRTGGRIRS